MFDTDHLMNAYDPTATLNPHKLACVFLVMALGVMFDLSRPLYHPRGEELFVIGRACINSVGLEHASPATVQAFLLWGTYVLNEKDEKSGDGAEKFWPIYVQYIADLVQMNNQKYDLIKEYAQTDTMTDEQADGVTKRWLTVDENVNGLRLKYLPKFRAVLSAKQTARFFQIDRRLQMMIELQLASGLPLVGGD